MDQTGTVQRLVGATSQPIKTPAPAKMLAALPEWRRLRDRYLEQPLHGGPFRFRRADTPMDATSVTPLPGPSWVGVSNGGTPWMISGGKTYLEDNNGLNQVGDWWPESFTGSPTSVAPPRRVDSIPTETTNNGDRSK